MPYHRQRLKPAWVGREIVHLKPLMPVAGYRNIVETEAQARCLLASGCDLLQGYYTGRPMALENVAGLFESSTRLSAKNSAPSRPRAD